MRNPVQSLSHRLHLALSKLGVADFGVDPVPLGSPITADRLMSLRRTVGTAILQAKVANHIATGSKFLDIDSALLRYAAVYRTVPYDWATAGGGGELPCDV